MKLTTADLARLAEIYGARPRDLLLPPEAQDLIAVLDRVQAIIGGMDQDVAEKWLAIGEALAHQPK